MPEMFMCTTNHFNPRPTKGATQWQHFLTPVPAISTHAPTKGATANFTKKHLYTIQKIVNFADLSPKIPLKSSPSNVLMTSTSLYPARISLNFHVYIPFAYIQQINVPDISIPFSLPTCSTLFLYCSPKV